MHVEDSVKLLNCEYFVNIYNHPAAVVIQEQFLRFITRVVSVTILWTSMVCNLYSWENNGSLNLLVACETWVLNIGTERSYIST